MKIVLVASWIVLTTLLTNSGGCDGTRAPHVPAGKVVKREDNKERARTTLHVKTGDKTVTYRHNIKVKCKVGSAYPACLDE